MADKDKQKAAAELAVLNKVENSRRGYYISGARTMILAVLAVAALFGLGFGLIHLPRYKGCSIQSVSEKLAMVVVEDKVPDGAAVKVELREKKGIPANLWQTIAAGMSGQRNGDKAIVDSRLVIPNLNGSTSVYFDAPFSTYTVSRVFYYGEDRNLFQLLTD